MCIFINGINKFPKMEGECIDSLFLHYFPILRGPKCNRKCKKNMTTCYLHRKIPHHCTNSNFALLPLDVIVCIINILPFDDIITLLHTSRILRTIVLDINCIEEFHCTVICQIHTCKKNGCKNRSVGIKKMCKEHTCHYNNFNFTRCFNPLIDGSLWCSFHKCKFPGCNAQCISKANWCIDHKCMSGGCNSIVVSMKKGCAAHVCKFLECTFIRNNSSHFCDIHLCKCNGCTRCKNNDAAYCNEHKCGYKDSTLGEDLLSKSRNRDCQKQGNLNNHFACDEHKCNNDNCLRCKKYGYDFCVNCLCEFIGCKNKVSGSFSYACIEHMCEHSNCRRAKLFKCGTILEYCHVHTVWQNTLKKCDNENGNVTCKLLFIV